MSEYKIYPKQFRNAVTPVEKNRIFFIMPFNKEFDYIYGSVKKELQDAGYICNRADEIAGSKPILNKILNEILKSQYIIADLTSYNPNVFYELGVSHTLKDAHSILLLKQRESKIPFDLSYLTYIEYETCNMKLLTSAVLNFLHEGQKINAFYDALNLHSVITFVDANQNDSIEYFQESLAEHLPFVLELLTGNPRKVAENKIDEILKRCQSIIGGELTKKQNDIDLVLRIYEEIVIACAGFTITDAYISNYLGDFFLQFNQSENDVLCWKIQMAVALAQKKKKLRTVLPWIINYFTKSKHTSIDLNRYRIETFLLTTNYKEVNQFLIASIPNEDCHVREHIADIISQKKLTDATTALENQLNKEENFYTASSIIAALGNLGDSKKIFSIMLWIDKNEKEMFNTKLVFPIKHAAKAIAKLDITNDKEYSKSFHEKYSSRLTSDFYLT